MTAGQRRFAAKPGHEAQTARPDARDTRPAAPSRQRLIAPDATDITSVALSRFETRGPACRALDRPVTARDPRSSCLHGSCHPRDMLCLPFRTFRIPPFSPGQPARQCPDDAVVLFMSWMTAQWFGCMQGYESIVQPCL
ncbi:hypothetical protein VTN96DRAFT_1814 [Rasamsonia emersonii]